MRACTLPVMGEERTGRYDTGSGNPSRTRVSVDEAARALGVTVDAIRKRVQRGTIPHERDGDAGRVWVLLEAASTMQYASDTVRDKDQDDTGHLRHELLEAKDENIADLKDRIASLERQLEDARTANGENRRLLAAALERIPAIEAPRESRDELGTDVRAPEPPPDTAGRSERASPRSGTTGPQTGAREPEEPSDATETGVEAAEEGRNPETRADAQTGAQTLGGEEETARRPWWVRWFGG